MTKRKNSKAFTLIELLVVISIITLLSAIVIAALGQARDKSQVAAGQSFASGIIRRYLIDSAMYFKFQEGTGTFVSSDGDVKVGNISGTNITWGTGIEGGALSWGTGTGGRVTVQGSATNILASATDNFFISAWVYPTTLTSGVTYPIVAGQANSSLLFGLVGGILELRMDDGSMYVNQNIPANKWTHVAVSYNGATQRATFYINGKVVGSSLNSDPSIDGYAVPELYIGYEARFGYGFQGLIDEVFMMRQTF